MPTGVVTSRWPVIASAGTTARTCVADTNVGAVDSWPKLPLNETDVAPSRFAPLIVTTAPTGAADGLKPKILGAGARTTRLCPAPAPIAITPARPLGTAHCPSFSRPQPHATTVPSLFSARLLMSPAAIATTPERPFGTTHWPQLMILQPQATTVPSLFRARLCA